MFKTFTREFERIDEADMITRGFIKGTEPMHTRRIALQQKLSGPVLEDTREELSRRADDLWARHEQAFKKRPVS